MVFDLFGAGSERRRSLTPGDKAYLLRVSRGKCEYCGEDIIGRGLTQHIHHIVEFRSRGSDRYHNLIVLCPNCHSLVHGLGISKEKLRVKIEYRLPKKSFRSNATPNANAPKMVVAKKVTAKKPKKSDKTKTMPKLLSKQELGALPVTKLREIAKNHDIKIVGTTYENIIWGTTYTNPPTKRQYINKLFGLASDKDLKPISK